MGTFRDQVLKIRGLPSDLYNFMRCEIWLGHVESYEGFNAIYGFDSRDSWPSGECDLVLSMNPGGKLTYRFQPKLRGER